MSEQLKNDAIAFIGQVEDVAKDEGYQLAKKEYESKLNALKSEYDVKVKAAYDLGLEDGYKMCKSEMNAGTKPDTPEPGHQDEPIDEPVEEPVNDPVNEGYSREKVVSELLAIKGNKSYAFGIVDTLGNVYADLSEWIIDCKPEVLGIGYTDGKHHLCMGINATASYMYGYVGKYDGVFTSTEMWSKVPSDYAGESNTDGIIKSSMDSIAAKCRAVTFKNGSKGYLPAYAELNAYWKRFEEVDKLLKGVGGDILRTTAGSQVMWTSTNKDDANAYGVLYYSAAKKSQPVSKGKTSKFPTRIFFNL